MDIATLQRLMKNPQLLDATTLEQLRDVVQRYPHFAIARILYFINLKYINPEALKSELPLVSLYAHRPHLFRIVEGATYDWSAWMDTKQATLSQTDSLESLIDSFLSHYGAGESQELHYEAGIGGELDYAALLMDTPDIEKDFSDDNSLIDTFLSHAAISTPFAPIVNDDESKENGEKTVSERNRKNELDGDDAFLTESLAKIYIKQRRFSKALEIIQRLNLKYPEKSIYFADQIRFLQKLIINSKN